MSSSRCFERATLVALAVVVVAAAAAAPAAAASIGSENVPDDAQVGQQITATVTLTELYRSPQLEEWQVTGRTSLTNATWTVVLYDQTGAKVTQESNDGATLNATAVKAADGTAEVEVRVTGTVPRIGSYSYDPPQRFTVMALTQGRPGGSSTSLGEWRATHYTPASREARTALEEAQSTIQSTDADTSQAESTFARGVDAYEGGNFDNAAGLARDAQSQANAAARSSRTVELALYGAGALVLLGVVVGGVLWYRNQGDSYDKLG
jgi:hypothetical protein